MIERVSSLQKSNESNVFAIFMDLSRDAKPQVWEDPLFLTAMAVHDYKGLTFTWGRDFSGRKCTYHT